MKPTENRAFYPYQPAAWLKVTGADAAIYLQGQFTNDLKQSQRHDAVYGLWLNQKGKVLADSFVLPGGQPAEFFIGSYFSSANTIRERLEAYVVADEVVIEDATLETKGISLLGSDAAEWLEKPPAGTIAFTGRRRNEQSVEWVFPREREAEIYAKLLTLGWRELSPTEMEYQRIVAGLPAVPQDIGPADLPNEGGLEASAISYTKGCYLGQEVMARLKSMGQVRRRLVRITAKDEPIPVLPAPIFSGERRVGELRSAAQDHEGNLVGLALLSLMHLQPGIALSLAPNGPATLRIVENP
jgi:folate-binding protein YgfZ